MYQSWSVVSAGAFRRDASSAAVGDAEGSVRSTGSAGELVDSVVHVAYTEHTLVNLSNALIVEDYKEQIIAFITKPHKCKFCQRFHFSIT